jgi:hypothetical protein
MEELLKIGVVGSRGFNDYKLLKDTLDKYLDKVYIIVSGGAKGADSLGERWAKENNVKTLIIRPEWRDRNGKYNPSAGFDRNVNIVDNSDFIIAFWDGMSRGTENTIHLTKEQSKRVVIIYYNKVF